MNCNCTVTSWIATSAILFWTASAQAQPADAPTPAHDREAAQTPTQRLETSSTKPGHGPEPHDAGVSQSQEGDTRAQGGSSGTSKAGDTTADLPRQRSSSVGVIPTNSTRTTSALPSPNAHLRYVLERVEVQGNTTALERVVLRYVNFRHGDILDVEDEEFQRLRYRLLGTGFFQSVDLSLRKGSMPGSVVLVIRVTERNTLVLSDVWMGLSADADTAGRARPLTAYAGVDMAERNLLGTGITLGGGLAFSHNQYAMRARFFDPVVADSHWMLSATLMFNHAREFYGNRDVLYDDPNNWTVRVQDHAVVQYDRRGGSLGIGRDLSAISQTWFTYRLERLDASLPLAASHMRGNLREPISFGLNRGKSVLSAIQGTLRLDTRDSPLLPSKGWFVEGNAELSLSPLGSSYPYEKYTFSASSWSRLPWGHVLGLTGFAGAISGYAPIYKQFYVGDFTDFLPGRMLGLNTDRRPAPNFLGTDIVEIRYGTYAAKLAGEYRIPLYRGSRSVYGVDLFSSAGIFALASEHDIKRPPAGYSGASAIPVDLTFNLGLRIDTNAGGFMFALSNVVGFLPFRGGEEL